MKRILMALILTAVLAPGILGISCREEETGYTGAVETLSIGTTNNEVNTLLLIALDQGYFTANGINLTHKIYNSGVAAIDAMLKNEVDMAVGSEYAFAGQIFAGKDISTVGIINKSSVNYLVGRIDRGIASISDLKGKKIGVPIQSRPEFALNRFLIIRGINITEVTLVNVPVNQSMDALMSGKVDAVTAWEPYISQIVDLYGSGLVIWSTQENQPSYSLIMCNGDWTGRNLEPIKRFLKSLIQAESYVRSNPDLVKVFIQKELGYSTDYVTKIWTDNDFTILLEQSLILAMEDEARWMISSNLTTEQTVPNFLDYIYVDSLKAVKPGAVKIAGK